MSEFEEMVKKYNAATPEGASREVPPPPDEAGGAETHITQHFEMTPTSSTAEIGVQTDVSYDCKIDTVVPPPGLRGKTALASEARRRKKASTKAAKKTEKISCHNVDVSDLSGPPVGRDDHELEDKVELLIKIPSAAPGEDDKLHEDVPQQPRECGNLGRSSDTEPGEMSTFEEEIINIEYIIPVMEGLNTYEEVEPATENLRDDSPGADLHFDFDTLEEQISIMEKLDSEYEKKHAEITGKKILKDLGTLTAVKKLKVLGEQQINAIGRQTKKGAKMMSAKTLDENGFVKIEKGITSDSGASDTVAPEELFGDYPLDASPGSLSNVWYVGAGGERIKNQGQRSILMLTKEKHLRWMTVQVAKVKNMLGSVSKNNDCGQRVVYDKSESFIMDKVSGEKVNLERTKGVFRYDGWVVPYAMVKTGHVTYIGKEGKKLRIEVNKEASFSRQV